MIVGVDANISIKVVRLLQTLYSEHDFRPVGGGPANDDTLWIAEFADAGGEALLTLDKRIQSRPHEVLALFNSGLLTCAFDFGKLKDMRAQAILILEYWRTLERQWLDDDPPRVIRALAAQSRLTPHTRELEYWDDNGEIKLRTK
ncbi:MAG: hypothetical protein AAF292_16650 [Pseudomonadota bacterium]